MIYAQTVNLLDDGTSVEEEDLALQRAASHRVGVERVGNGDGFKMDMPEAVFAGILRNFTASLREYEC